MLLIRIYGKDYTFSREAWAALVGATNSMYTYYYPARGQNLTVNGIESLISPFTQITKPIINPQELDAISAESAAIAHTTASYFREQLEELINKLYEEAQNGEIITYHRDGRVLYINRMPQHN